MAGIQAKWLALSTTTLNSRTMNRYPRKKCPPQKVSGGTVLGRVECVRLGNYRANERRDIVIVLRGGAVFVRSKSRYEDHIGHLDAVFLLSAVFNKT